MDIIKTLAEVRDLNWHATLIGDGQDRDMIMGLCEEKGLSDRVAFPGWKTPEEVIEIFHHSDILFMPSLSEGLPVTGIQGMASGLALLLSNAGGNPEIIKEGVNGFVQAPDDTKTYAHNLRTLLTDSDRLLKMRYASLELAASFDIRKTAADYLKAFNKIRN